MGWARGGALMDVVIDAVWHNVTDSQDRTAIYEKLIGAFWELDADTLDECKGVDPAFDEALVTSGYSEEE